MDVNLDNKFYEIGLYVNASSKIIETYQQKIHNVNNEKEENTLSNETVSRVKRKSELLNSDYIHVQDKMSLIQTQEVKVDTLEEMLQKIKTLYLNDMNNEKKEFLKEKIKIRKLSKEIDKLDNKFENTIPDKDTIYIENQSEIIELIDDTLKKLDKKKHELSKYKSKLISLEQELKKSKSRLIECEKSIDKEIILEPIDFVSVKGEIDTELTLDLLI